MNIEDFIDIAYEKEDETGIVTVTINQPKRKNAFSQLTFLELFWAVDHVQNDENAYAMILTGAKDPESDDPKNQYFSSGGYFNPNALNGVKPEFMQQIDFQDIAQKKLAVKMWECDKPIVAAINGIGIGAGFTLPLCGADLIYASEQAWFRLPFVKLGIVPEFAITYLLPRLMGFQKAKEILLMGEDITAQELCDLGIVNKVLPHEEVLAYAKEMTLKLIPPKGAGLAVKMTKQALHKDLLEKILGSLDLENAGLNAAVASADFMENMAAKREKRDPVYKGK